MVFYVRTPKRRLIISELYLMLFTFFISYTVTKIVMQVIERRGLKTEPRKGKIEMVNPRGGDSIGKLSKLIQVTDEQELAFTILSCIQDNHRYLLKDKRLTQIIFGLVKASLTDQALVITPNMLRFVALQLLKNNENNLKIKFGNVIFESMNRGRIIVRGLVSVILGIIAAATAAVPYGILATIIYFDLTRNCAFKCSKHFEHLPPEGPIVLKERPIGKRLFIADNKSNKQLDIYVPSLKEKKKISLIAKEQLEEKQLYKKDRRKVKEIKFTDFQKNDPVLSSFRDQNLKEPQIAEANCATDDIREAIDIRIG